MKNFLKLVEENTPGNSKYEIVLRGPDECVVSKVDLSGTEYAYDLFSKIKHIIELIEQGKDIELSSEEENENGLLASDEKEAVELANSLVKDPKRRLDAFSDPKKNLQKALGDMYNVIADKVKAVARSV